MAKLFSFTAESKQSDGVTPFASGEKAVSVRLGRAVRPYRHILLAALIIVVIALGYIGFGATRGFSPLDRIYDSLELFQGKYDGRAGSANWELNTARFLALGAFLYGLALALGAMFRDQAQGLRARIVRDHIVVCGLGDVGTLAAVNLREEGHRVVAVEQDEHHPNIGRCRNAGVLVLKGDATTDVMLREARIAAASHLIVTCGTDARNAEVIASARGILRRRRQQPVRAIVEIDDAELGEMLTDAAFAERGDGTMTVEFFNVSDRGAEKMLSTYPFDELVEHATEPHIVIVGLGEFGSTLVEHAALRWRQTYGQRRLFVTVVDRHATRNVHHIQARNPSIGEVCVFDEKNWYVGEPDAQRDGEGRILEPLLALSTLAPARCVYVCLGDDAASLTAGVSLHRSNPNTRVVVRTSHRPSLTAFLGETALQFGDTGGLFSFDVLDYVCQTDVLFQGPHERLARAIHQRHVASQRRRGLTEEESGSMRGWEELDETFRDASRAHAEDVAAKLELIGYRIVRLTDWRLPLVEFGDGEIEAMAQHEHRRWCDERRGAGWELGETKDIEGKVHPLLVPWEELNEEDKEYDRRLVREVPAMLAEIGYTIAPIRGPAQPLPKASESELLKAPA